MDIEQVVSDVRGSEPGSDDLRVSPASTNPVGIEDLRELRIESLDDIVRLMQRYQEVNVPREPGNVFLEHLTMRRDSWFVEVGDLGLVYLTNVIPEFTGTMHVLFWDQKLPVVRVPLVQEVVRSAFDLFALKKINVTTTAKPMGDFLKKIGFSWEGNVRRGTIIDGAFTDVRLFGIIPEEVTWPQA